MSGNIRTRKLKNGKVSYQVIIERGTDSNGKRLRDFYTYKTKKEDVVKYLHLHGMM